MNKQTPAIPADHPIWTATEWDEAITDEWMKLPGSLLRWFACDCAERACSWVGRCEVSSVRAILTGRLFEMALCNGEDLGRAEIAAKTATLRVSPQYPNIAPGAGLRWGACMVAASAVAPDAASAAYWASDFLSSCSKDSEEDDLWQLSRLRYLCTCWNLAGGLHHVMEALMGWRSNINLPPCPKEARL